MTKDKGLVPVILTLKKRKKENRLSEDFSLNIHKIYNHFRAETLKTDLVIDQDSIVPEILRGAKKSHANNIKPPHIPYTMRQRAYVKVKEVSVIHLFVPPSNKELLT